MQTKLGLILGLLLTASSFGSITDMYRSEMADNTSEADAAEQEMASKDDDFGPVLQRYREAIYHQNNQPITNNMAQAEKSGPDPIEQSKGKRLPQEQQN